LAVSSVLQLTKIVADATYIEVVEEPELKLHLYALTEPSKIQREAGIRVNNIL
jgi:hypothetical protein